MNRANKFFWKSFDQTKRNFLIWFVLGIIASLFIHFLLIKKIGNFEIASFNPTSFDSIIPRRFHLERVKIDPALLEHTENKKIDSLPQPIEISNLEKGNDYYQKTFQQNEHKPEPLDNKELEEEKPSTLLKNNIIPENFQRPNQPLLPLDSVTKESSIDSFVDGKSNGVKGYSEIDQLLEQKAPLSSQTAPILLPTDLLFEYNADYLKKDAEESLKKLALLIQRNPKAQFIVEGFTDSFGSEEYNLNLSTRRADSIKEWLIKKELINPNQIESYGLGKTHFLVPSSGNIQQQSLNRRVEIVIRQNKNP